METATVKYDAGPMHSWEDMSAFIGVKVNHEQVIVCRENDKIVGAVMLWDGGHSVVSVDHLIVPEQDKIKRSKITHALLSAVCIYIKKKGADYMIFVAGEIEIAYLAKKRGAAVIGPMYRMLFKV